MSISNGYYISGQSGMYKEDTAVWPLFWLTAPDRATLYTRKNYSTRCYKIAKGGLDAPVNIGSCCHAAANVRVISSVGILSATPSPSPAKQVRGPALCRGRVLPQGKPSRSCALDHSDRWYKQRVESDTSIKRRLSRVMQHFRGVTISENEMGIISDS